jgi:hypothetical protein
MEYVHMPQAAPTMEMLKEYRGNGRDWTKYTMQYLVLLQDRNTEDSFPPTFFETPSVLLCSEHTAEHCHRRLLLEYLRGCGHDIEPSTGSRSTTFICRRIPSGRMLPSEDRDTLGGIQSSHSCR